MDDFCELPFDKHENCSITLGESFEPYSSILRVFWMLLTSALFVTMVPLNVYYLYFLRGGEQKGPVKTSKLLLALASPLIIILSFLYAFIGFFWRQDARSIEGRLSFMILTTIVTLDINLMMANQVSLSETMAFHTEKKWSNLVFKLSLIWQVTAILGFNAIFLFAELSFTQALVLSTLAAATPQIFLAPYNIVICLDFRAVLRKHIVSEVSAGKDTKELVKIYQKVSQTLTFFRFSCIYFGLDALVLIPFFQNNIIYVSFQTMGKILMVTLACPLVGHYFLNVISEDMSNTFTRKLHELKAQVQSTNCGTVVSPYDPKV